MLEKYFNMRYCFDRDEVVERIDQRLQEEGSGYICVADGVVLNIANRDADYRKVTDGAMFSICDSSYVPLYLNWIYGIKREQYCGAMIFRDLVSARGQMHDSQCTMHGEGSKYRMIFMGTSQNVLDGLKKNLTENFNPDCAGMQFVELPFRKVEEFDYPEIAKMIEEDGADIVWVALGAPKQDFFMNRLQTHLHHGVMIGVGAAFKFYSGQEEKRAPQWMVRHHMEFIYRIWQDPKKQLSRCWWIVRTLPNMFFEEVKRKHQNAAK